jgi:hypothetical protein
MRTIATSSARRVADRRGGIGLERVGGRRSVRGKVLGDRRDERGRPGGRRLLQPARRPPIPHASAGSRP